VRLFSVRLLLPPPDLTVPSFRFEAASTLEDDMSAVYTMLSSLASCEQGAAVTAPEYE
jgi:hypothetical protein